MGNSSRKFDCICNTRSIFYVSFILQWNDYISTRIGGCSPRILRQNAEPDLLKALIEDLSPLPNISLNDTLIKKNFEEEKDEEMKSSEVLTKLQDEFPPLANKLDQLENKISHIVNEIHESVPVVKGENVEGCSRQCLIDCSREILLKCQRSDISSIKSLKKPFVLI